MTYTFIQKILSQKVWSIPRRQRQPMVILWLQVSLWKNTLMIYILCYFVHWSKSLEPKNNTSGWAETWISLYNVQIKFPMHYKQFGIAPFNLQLASGNSVCFVTSEGHDQPPNLCNLIMTLFSPIQSIITLIKLKDGLVHLFSWLNF